MAGNFLTGWATVTFWKTQPSGSIHVVSTAVANYSNGHIFDHASVMEWNNERMEKTEVTKRNITN
jgi:hypothetical protein